MGIEAVKVRFRIMECRYCGTHDRGQGPIPMDISAGGNKAKLAILVPEPNNEEIQRHQLYRKHPGNNLLRAYVNRKFDQDEVAWVPVQACQGSVANCRTWLEAQLYALPELQCVLLPGKYALDAWRTDLLLKNMAGHTGVMLDRWKVYVSHNPETIAIGHGDREDFKQQMTWVDHLVHGDIDYEQFEQFDCPVKGCGFEGTERDRDGVWYCVKHNKTHGGNWKKARKQWDQEKLAVTQPRLNL